MNRTTLLGMLLLIPAILMFGAVGCTNKAKPKDDVDDEPIAKKGKGGKAKGEPINEALEATVTGVVKIKGKAPAEPVIDAIAKHGDAAVCLKGDTKEQTWHVNNDGRVANVIIILAPPAGKRFSDKVNDKVKKEVVVDQPVCQYVPHVVGVYGPVQKLIARNDAPVNHNVKIQAGGDVGTIDVNLAPKGKDGTVKQTDPISLAGLGREALIDARCSIHTWMNAKIAVFDHPYFGVTNDKGEFKIENVPVNTELTVYMWHESMGGLNKKAEQKKMSFKKGDNSLGELSIGQ
jgi:hypothetical protein